MLVARYGLGIVERSGRDIFDLRGINRYEGCVLMVRPDQRVAHVLPL